MCISNDCEEILNLILSDDHKNSEFTTVTGGLRNSCYCYESNLKKYFVKMYNPDVKYSKHMSQCRCVCEYAICKYLKSLDCNVPNPLFYDEKHQVGIYEYINGSNLKSFNKVIDEKLCKDIIDCLTKVHKTPVIKAINGCEFEEISKDDILRYLEQGLKYLCELYEKNYSLEEEESFLKSVADVIDSEKRVWGNMQMHDGNVIVTNDSKIFLCDFEKVCPHFPQMDLISFLNSRRFDIGEDIKLIDYYIDINGIEEKDKFYEVYDLLYIIDDLRVLKKIKLNADGYKVKWINDNGKRYKIVEKTESNKGIIWNKDRNETIDGRIKSIFSKRYSDNELSNHLRSIILDITH